MEPQLNVPFAEYLAWSHVSQSSLKQGRVSMLHMLHAMNEDVVPTDAMNLGSAIHCAFLEPELLPEKVVLWKGKRRAGNEWEDFKTEHKGKIILTNGYYEHMKGMIRRLRQHPEMGKGIVAAGDVEVSHKMEINGVMVKGRTDKLTNDPIIDLKSSAADLDETRFATQAVKLGYHIQGAIYLRLFDRKRFILGVVENTAPYDVVMFELSPELLAIGDREAMLLLGAWKACCENQHYPGRNEELVTLEVPKWMQPQEQPITTGGVPAFT